MTFFRVSSRSNLLTAVGLMLLGASGALQAGEITGFTWSSGIASVGLNPIAVPVAPNNDDAIGPSPNVVFVHQKNYIGIGPVDIEFTVFPSGGVTEYRFMEGVQNGTGIPWTDYHIQLGFGMGTAFVPSPSGDGLDFDHPDLSSPFSFAPFTTVVVGEDGIDAYNGVVPNATFVSPFVFHVDVPDGISAFTVRQYPTIDSGTVPEPSSAVLILAGVFAAIGSNRRRI